MPADYTTAGLIAKIENYTLETISPTTVPYNRTQVLSRADDMIRTRIVPFLTTLRDEYFVAVLDVPLVVGQTEYDIPEESIALKLRKLAMINSAGDSIFRIPQVALDTEEATFAFGFSNYTFRFQGNKIVLSPAPASTGDSLRLYYFKRPKELSTSANALTISEKDSTTTVTVSESTLPAWAVAGARVVIQKAGAPFTLLNDTITVASINGSAPWEITFTEAYNIDVAVGDYVTAEDTVFVPEVPIECFSWLARLVGAQMLMSRGDGTAAQFQMTEAAHDEAVLLRLFTKRSEGNVKKVVSPYGIMYRGSSGRRGRW